jgi:two-component system, cell cycle response regulator CpdR
MPEPRAGTARATILVVDDNDDVRLLTCTMLEALGHDVLELADAGQAPELVGRPGGAVVDLLLTDVSMRPLSGIALAERIRALRPELPIVFMSGDPAIAAVDELLVKPFTYAALDDAVRRALGAGGT